MPRIRIQIPNQRIILGDCLDVFANERNVSAFVSDPPANIGFMGRSWDRAHPATDFVLPGKPRSKAHESEWRRKEAFIRYWAERYAMAYDIADQHATNIVWTLPRTSHQMAEALERAGWTIKDNLVHLFGTGWAKTGNALAPGQEGWLLATKGKPDLDIDACRVPRGAGENFIRPNTNDEKHPGWDRPWRRDPEAIARKAERRLASNEKSQSLGSLPKNALLSHCEECVRVGVKRVKGSHDGTSKASSSMGYHGNGAANVEHASHTEQDGTESVPAWHCLAGCACGARAVWDPENPLPRCSCGEVWRWFCAVAEVNEQSGESKSTMMHRGSGVGYGGGNADRGIVGPTDQGGSSRFFNTFSYLSKCSSSERHAGCENLYWRANKKNPFGFDQVTREEWEAIEVENQHLACIQKQARRERTGKAQGNVHPTVKSYKLMHWLHSITSAPRVLDMTGGSGTGMYTAYLDGIEWLGAEICPEAIVIAEARYAFWRGLSLGAVAAFMDQKPMKQILRMQNKTS